MRRSLIAVSAALAAGGSLAVASVASATSIPTGSVSDTGNASLYGLLNQTDTGLIQAQNLIVLENGILVSKSQPPIDANFTTAYTSASSLTATTVAEIATDIAASANTTSLEFGTCVSGYLSAASLPPTNANVTAGATYCAGTPSAVAAATTKFTGTIQPGVATAAASWGSLKSLVSVVTADPTDFPGGLFTVDGDVSISSTATVTGVGQPVAYTASFGVSGAATTGFVLPSGFTLTFPANFTVHAAIVADEIQASQEANPPAASAIGTATVVSPEIAALVPGSKGVDSAGQVFVVQGASLTQPIFEVYLGQGIYILGNLNGVSFPLTVTFGAPIFGGQPTPLPVSRVTLSFPAATSPLQATSCTSLGTLTGTMTDSVSALAAAYFGDTSDSGAVAMSASATTVTNACAAATGTMGGLTTGSPTLTVKIKTGTAFSGVTLGLPKGLSFVNSKRLAKEVKAAGAKIKSARIAGGKLVVTLKSKVQSVTIKTVKPVISETKALALSIKKHKTKTLSVSVLAGSIALKATIKA